MAIVTKSELAKTLGISRGRVTQFLSDGLPALPDGKIDSDAALNWVARNCLGPSGDKARALLRGEKANEAKEDDEDPVAAAAHMALGCLFVFVPNIAAWAAIDALYGPDCDIDAIPDEEFKRIFRRASEAAHARAIRAGDLVITKMLKIPPRGSEWPDLEMCGEFGGYETPV